KELEVKNPAQTIQTACEEWLRSYPEYRNSPEGSGVRFELAQVYLAQALAVPKSDRQSARVRDIFEKAGKLFQGLEQLDNEFSPRAREAHLRVMLALYQDRPRGDINALKD